jgi:hypothetical protein
MPTGHMRYVVCPKCGDAVAGRLPSGDEPRKVQCVHCYEEFAFVDSETKSGLVSYDESRNRWQVAKMSLSRRGLGGAGVFPYFKDFAVVVVTLVIRECGRRLVLAYRKRFVDPKEAHRQVFVDRANWYSERAAKLGAFHHR